MADRSYDRGGLRVLELGPAGAPIAGDRDAADLVGAAFETRARLIVIPVARLCDDFFRLASGVAGSVLQKFVNYRLRVVIVGDLSGHVARSETFKDFVEESNRGSAVWFAATPEALEARLLSAPPP